MNVRVSTDRPLYVFVVNDRSHKMNKRNMLKSMSVNKTLKITFLNESRSNIPIKVN